MPAEYTSVKDLYPTQLKNELWEPASPSYVSPKEFSSYNTAVTEEFQWLVIYGESLSTECLSPGWATHDASQERSIQTPPGINTILQLLRDKVSTFNMQAHLMQLNTKWTAVSNPGQFPVDVGDQPVYAHKKELQFRHPDIFSQYFLIFGQLYIEQSVLVIHGQLIEDSGLVQIVTENKFSMIGLSAVVDVNNMKRTRYTLQITLCALFIKLPDAASASETDLSPCDWLPQKSKDNTWFLYWKCVIDLQRRFCCTSVPFLKVISNYMFRYCTNY